MILFILSFWSSRRGYRIPNLTTTLTFDSCPNLPFSNLILKYSTPLFHWIIAWNNFFIISIFQNVKTENILVSILRNVIPILVFFERGITRKHMCHRHRPVKKLHENKCLVSFIFMMILRREQQPWSLFYFKTFRSSLFEFFLCINVGVFYTSKYELFHEWWRRIIRLADK